MMLVAALFSSVSAFASAEGAHDVEIDVTQSTHGNELDLTVSLTRNDGIVALVLRIDYDDKALTYKSLTYGSALASCFPGEGGLYDPILDIGAFSSPCIANYATGAGKNDSSTGRLFTLTFEKDANVATPRISVTICDLAYKNAEGKTQVSEKYGAQMPYTTGGVTIMEAGDPAVVPDPEESGTRTLVIVLACVGGAAVLGGGAAAYLLYRKKNDKATS